VITILFAVVAALARGPQLCPAGFNGLDISLGNLSRVSKAKPRSLSAENVTGEKGGGGMATNGTGAGAARELGLGWKVSPSVRIKAGTTFTLGDVKGPGSPTGAACASVLSFCWRVLPLSPFASRSGKSSKKANCEMISDPRFQMHNHHYLPDFAVIT